MSEAVAVSAPGRRSDQVQRLLDVPPIAGRVFDVLVVVGLAVVGYLVRRDGLLVDGLWFDDSWVAAGAAHGEIGSLMMTGTGHPTFTALLMAVNALGGGSITHLSWPAFLAGIAAAPALYLALRHLGFARSIVLLLSAALVVNDVHVLYAGRVKGYTLDTLLVIGLAVAIPALARITWRWWIAVAWVVSAWLLGGFSGYVLVATAVAMFVMFLHPNGDRWVRFGALVVQGIGQLIFYLVAQRMADLAQIEEVNEKFYDSHMDLHLNPIEFWNESIEHLRRVAEVFPGGTGPWLTVFAIAAVVGLVIGVVRGRRPSETLPAQFFLLMVAGAFVGALLHKFPFGPLNDNPFSAGGRHSLWLVPAMAFGLAIVLQRLRSLIGPLPARRAFDAALVVASLAVLVIGYTPAFPYPFGGSESAVRFVESDLGPNDSVFVSSTDVFKVMVSTKTPVSIIATPDRMVGFVPHFDDPRFHTIEIGAELGSTDAQIQEAIDRSDRVFVVAQDYFAKATFTKMAGFLEAAGFEMVTHTFDSEVVQVWER